MWRQMGDYDTAMGTSSMELNSKEYFDLFFFNDTATTKIYTLSLHDALPIFYCVHAIQPGRTRDHGILHLPSVGEDRKSTRLNSSHTVISYAVFCLHTTT